MNRYFKQAAIIAVLYVTAHAIIVALGFTMSTDFAVGYVLGLLLMAYNMTSEDRRERKELEAETEKQRAVKLEAVRAHEAAVAHTAEQMRTRDAGIMDLFHAAFPNSADGVSLEDAAKLINERKTQ